MPTVILSAASPEQPSLQALLGLLTDELWRAGESNIRTFDLATTKLAYCQGEFDCWVKSPGVCRAHDAEEAIVRAIHDADQLIMLDAITFGGYSYTVKRALDRLICLLSPFFEKRASLTHHGARYEHTARFVALGWTAAADEEVRRTWQALADANALNMLAPSVGTAVLSEDSRDTWAADLRTALASTTVPGTAITAREPLRAALLAAAAGGAGAPGLAAPESAALVVGSAKARGTSVSECLAHALRARLEGTGLTVETHFATDFLRDDHAGDIARRIAAVDLVVLVTPLYVDAFPALATRVLEYVAQARARAPSPARFAAVVNCGFPEAEHIRTALRIARHFADRAGYVWSGGLPLGGGGTLNPTVPLDGQHGPAEHVKAALDQAAASLAQGDAIPADAIAQMSNTPIPDALYRFMGDIGWRYQAFKQGLSQAALRSRPLDVRRE